ncbi:endospore germination permease [Gracilibacillus sp. S3-1-1]|uniref:Endospore germination permease n=1 Tax=Gracilibacillus pellucidus TaxID=3095368 RepID=A0ACC6M6F0_9BACI|nr:endospore germination permease [Gracilibacillus sp. S3-1-1]MDX8046451.1 endospore germination permease [Gracilibacillus sp. S3-1-1]
MIEKLDTKQFTVLVMMNTLGASIIFIPSIATNFGKENGWITLILATLIGALILCLYRRIIQRLEGSNFFTLIEKSLGKWIGKIVISLFCFYTFINVSANLWSISDFISIQILMGTPFEVVSFLIILTVLVAVRYGIEVIGRTSELFFPFAMICAILLTLLVIKDAELTNILPIFQLNRASTIAGIIPIISITYLELVILLAIAHTVNQNIGARKGIMIGGIASGFILIIITIASIAVLGVQGTSNYIYPIYALGQRINIFNFFERVEIIVAFIWFFTIFSKLCVSFYVLISGIQYLIPLKTYKTWTIPFTFLAFLASIQIIPNTIAAFPFINGPYTVISIIVGFIIPLLLFACKWKS